ncbi:unnamed protein product [Effrenium voratum]|nr:unnamed protein product [Effrenium voratum]
MTMAAERSPFELQAGAVRELDGESSRWQRGLCLGLEMGVLVFGSALLCQEGLVDTQVRQLAERSIEASFVNDGCCRFAHKFQGADWHDPEVQEEFLANALVAESRFYTEPGLSFDPDSGMTMDGIGLDLTTGEAVPDTRRQFSAASKEALHLSIIAVALQPLEDAKPELRKLLPLAYDTEKALDVLERKVKSLEDFDAEFPAFGGFLPWFCPRGINEQGNCKGADETFTSIAPMKAWSNSLPGLDNGQLAFGTAALVHVLEKRAGESSRFAKLAERWNGRLQRMKDSVVNLFYEGAGSGQVRSIATLRDVKVDVGSSAWQGMAAIDQCWAESYIGEVAVVKENEKGRFGFIKAEGFSKEPRDQLKDAMGALLAEALSEQWSALAPADEMETDEATARVSGQSSKRGPEHKILEQVTHEGADLRESMPFKEKTMPVDEVFFTHGQVSPQFRNGGSLTQLLGDLRRGRLLPQTDPRLRLDVVKLAKVRSVNNRRLWVLKEFQQELRRHRPKSDTVKVAVRLHPLCKGTAKFLSELCNAAACSEKEQPDIHPEDNTRRTLLNISSAALEDGVVCRWVLESRAEERSKVPVNDLTYLGAPNSVGVKRRRCGGVAGSAVPPLTRQQREACERVEQGERVDAVQFDGKLFVVDRDLGQALHARQQQGRQICAEVRVIPLCPMTAKFVMANSSSNNGKSVDIRGTLQANAEWPLDRIVMVVLSLALRLSNCPRAPDIYGVLASSRLLGERSALISAIRSKRRFAQQVQEQVWPFMQQVMRMQASKFNMAMPVCKFLANDRHGREGAVGSELLALLDRAAQQLADQPDPTNTAWHCLPATPTAEEITRLQILPDGKQRGRALDLPVVRQVGSYRSTSDYLDTYFRLLREDCISSLRKSLADLRDRGEQAQHAQEEGNPANSIGDGGAPSGFAPARWTKYGCVCVCCFFR